MFAKEYGCEWVKDKAVTCSNWSNPQLSLTQVKYAALDAWVSCMVGLKVQHIKPVDLSPWAPNLLARIAVMNKQRAVMEEIQKKEFKISGDTEIRQDGREIVVAQDKFPQRVRVDYNVIASLTNGDEVIGKVFSVSGKRAVLKMLTKITSGLAEITANNYSDRDKCLEGQSNTICDILLKAKIGSTLLQQLFITSPTELFETTYNPDLVLRLNHSQKSAVKTAVQNPISAIIGPPGTGKTSTIACIAQSLTTKPNNEVVVIAARQNVAALNVLQALIKRGVEGCLLYVSDDYYVEWHEDDYEHVKDAYVVVGAAIDPLRKWRKYNPGFRQPSVVVCTTGCLTSSKALLEVLPIGYSTLLLDECSQMWLGEIVPILHTRGDHLKRLVLVGDHHQLPPFGADDMNQAGLDSKSLFEYCLDEKRFAQQLLNEQYRMPPAIGDFISQSFYNGSISTSHTDPLPPSVSKLTQKRVLWVDTQGRQQLSETKSSYNLEEMAQVVQLVQYFTKHHAKPQDVVVITPYEEQRTRIEAALKQVPQLQQMFKNQTIVYCIDSYQGREAPIVILSLVVSNVTGYLGFVEDKHRLNVMLSRAKSFMCVVGSYMTVKKSKRANIFASLRSIACTTNFERVRPMLEQPQQPVDFLASEFKHLVSPPQATPSAPALPRTHGKQRKHTHTNNLPKVLQPRKAPEQKPKTRAPPAAPVVPTPAGVSHKQLHRKQAAPKAPLKPTKHSGTQTHKPLQKKAVEQPVSHDEVIHSKAFWTFLSTNAARKVHHVAHLGHIYNRRYLGGKEGAKFAKVLDSLVKQGHLCIVGASVHYTSQTK